MVFDLKINYFRRIHALAAKTGQNNSRLITRQAIYRGNTWHGYICPLHKYHHKRQPSRSCRQP